LRTFFFFPAVQPAAEVPCMDELNPAEAYRRDRLAQELLSTWSRQQIVEWLQQLNNADYREDMRARLNQQRKEMPR